MNDKFFWLHRSKNPDKLKLLYQDENYSAFKAYNFIETVSINPRKYYQLVIDINLLKYLIMFWPPLYSQLYDYTRGGQWRLISTILKYATYEYHHYHECLYISATYGHLEIIKRLLRSGKVSLSSGNNLVLVLSIKHKQRKIFDFLLSYGINYSIGQTDILISAHNSDDPYYLKMVLDFMKIPVNANNAVAILRYGSYKLFETLLENGRIDVQTDLARIFKMAAKTGKLSIVKLLVDKFSPDDILLYDAMAKACKYDYNDIIELLSTHLKTQNNSDLKDEIDILSKNLICKILTITPSSSTYHLKGILKLVKVIKRY